MTSLNKQLYALMKDDVASAKAWFEAEELDAADYHDVIAFRVGHVKGNKVEASSIASDIVRNLTEAESVVHFIKITKKLARPHNAEAAPFNTMTYVHRTDNRTAGKLLSSTKTYFEQGSVCRYMPATVVVPSADPNNPISEDITLGREDSGKYVCDALDAMNQVSIQSKLRGLPQEYEEGKVSLPVINQIVEIPNYVVNTIALLASVGDGVYRHDSAKRAFNGIIVTPILIMYSRITNLYITTQKY